MSGAEPNIALLFAMFGLGTWWAILLNAIASPSGSARIELTNLTTRNRIA